MQAKKQQLDLDMGQLTGSKLGKEYIKAVYCHLSYLTYMQSTSCKRPYWKKKWQPTLVFLPGESPWTEVSGGLQPMGSQRVRHN